MAEIATSLSSGLVTIWALGPWGQNIACKPWALFGYAGCWDCKEPGMLVLLGPAYGGSDREIGILGQETGLSGYDLRARLRPGAWGVIRAIADEHQAMELARRLCLQGLPACSIDSSVGQDSVRRIVYLRALRCDSHQILLRFVERTMTVPLGALLVIVRGEVHMGRSPHPTSAGVGSMRPSASSVSLLSSNPAQEVFREVRAPVDQDVFAAADIHFATVPWVARIDARELDFPPDYVDVPNLAERMDRCLEDLSRVSGIRIDRGIKTSSLASHTAGTPRATTPLPGSPSSVRRGQGPSDDHFDAYSRMIAEAERAIMELPRSKDC